MKVTLEGCVWFFIATVALVMILGGGSMLGYALHTPPELMTQLLGLFKGLGIGLLSIGTILCVAVIIRVADGKQ